MAPPGGRSGSALAERKTKLEREDIDLIFRVLFDDEADGLKYLAKSGDRVAESVSPTKVFVGESFPVVVKSGAPVLVGGSGVVIQCEHTRAKGVKYALKVPRPSLAYHRTTPRQEHQREIEEYLKHAPLSHENIARAISSGKLVIPDASGVHRPEHDVLLLEWIDGAESLRGWLADSCPDHRTVVKTLMQCFEALAHLHRHSLIHWDIKSENLLVSQDRTVKLTDIGNARRLDPPEPNLGAYSTRGNTPPALPRESVRLDRGKGLGSNRVRIELPDRAWDSPWLDMWMLGRELNRLFWAIPGLVRQDQRVRISGSQLLEATHRRFLNRVFPPEDGESAYVLRYIQLVLRRLLFPDRPSAPRYYDAADRVASDLAKLLTEFGSAQSIHELHAIPQRVLRLPASGNLAWSSRMSRLLNEGLIRRLRKHKQLATISQVYPGATHTRQEHTAGVVATAAQYVRALYADRGEPFWRLEVDSSDIDALLLAGFLHDSGHVAFGHFLEEMGALLDGRRHEDYILLVLDPDRCDREQITAFGERARRGTIEDRALLRAALEEAWGIPESALDRLLHTVGFILRPPPPEDQVLNETSQLLTGPSGALKLQILSSIIDSAIDADKLDYLLRDAHHAGVQYPRGIDTDRFYQSLTVVPFVERSIMERDDSLIAGPIRASIGVTAKGVLPVESIMMARYHMFSCVYWHHTTRALTAMLQHAVLAYLGDGVTGASKTEDRLDNLLDEFRHRTDDDALVWLQDQVVSQRHFSAQRAAFFRRVFDGLLGRNREALYWRAFELRYDRNPASDAHRLHEGIMQVSGSLAEPMPPAHYVQKAKDLQVRFQHALSQRLPRKLKLTDGEVLLDIPPAGRDQIRNVFVVEAGGVTPIQEVSPVADAVGAAFRLWVRKPRVFMAPSAWHKCSAERVSEDAVWSASWDALGELVEAQLSLFKRKQRSSMREPARPTPATRVDH